MLNFNNWFCTNQALKYYIGFIEWHKAVLKKMHMKLYFYELSIFLLHTKTYLI